MCRSWRGELTPKSWELNESQIQKKAIQRVHANFDNIPLFQRISQEYLVHLSRKILLERKVVRLIQVRKPTWIFQRGWRGVTHIKKSVLVILSCPPHRVLLNATKKGYKRGGGWGAREEKGSRASLGPLTPATPLGWLRCDGLVLKRNDIRAIFKRVSWKVGTSFAHDEYKKASDGLQFVPWPGRGLALSRSAVYDGSVLTKYCRFVVGWVVLNAELFGSSFLCKDSCGEIIGRNTLS